MTYESPHTRARNSDLGHRAEVVLVPNAASNLRDSQWPGTPSLLGLLDRVDVGAGIPEDQIGQRAQTGEDQGSDQQRRERTWPQTWSRNGQGQYAPEKDAKIKPKV